MNPKLDSRSDEIEILSRQKATPKLVLVSLTTGSSSRDGIGHISKCHFSRSLPGSAVSSGQAARSFPLTIRPPFNEVLMNSGLRVFMDQ